MHAHTFPPAATPESHVRDASHDIMYHSCAPFTFQVTMERRAQELDSEMGSFYEPGDSFYGSFMELRPAASPATRPPVKNTVPQRRGEHVNASKECSRCH